MIKIIINGKQREFTGVLTYHELVSMAIGQASEGTLYTVTYSNAADGLSGTLNPCEGVFGKNGTVIKVVPVARRVPKAKFSVHGIPSP